MILRLLFAGLLLPTLAAAQQRPIFDPDDFVDPRQHDGAVFASRLVAGGALNYIDDYRPRHAGAGFVLFTNSFYWSSFQVDYKHSEVGSAPEPPLQMCPCNPPIFFPTPPSADSTPAPPPPGGKDTLQFGYYWTAPHTAIKLRSRLTVAQQPISTDATFLNTDTAAKHFSGRERSIGLDTDTYLPIGRGLFGTL